MAELGYADILRVGPGTLAGRFHRSFWQPVCRAEDIGPGHVKPVRLLGEDFTLYRGESGGSNAAFYAVADRCAHRGVSLRLGHVEGERLRCAYHGWAYDGTGQCVEQPSETRPFAERVKVTGYPTREYLGVVFVYMGEGEAPEFPRLGDYEDDTMYLREISMETWPVSYFDLLENATDIAHTAFLHWQFKSEVPTSYEWHESPGGMEGVLGGRATQAEMTHRAFFQMPTGAEFALGGGPGRVGYFTFAWRVPRDDDSAIRFNMVAFPRAEVEARVGKGGNAYAALRGTRDADVAARSTDDAADRAAMPVEALARRLLSGEEDMKSLKERSAGMNFRYLTNVQDCAVLMSLGPPSRRNYTENFGRTDASVALLRRLYLRELTALAEGKPVKSWQRPAFLWSDLTDLHRRSAKELVTAK